MKKGLTEVIFILDRSGSMSGLEADTIGGFNALIEKQKKETGEAYVSTILFDHEIKTLHDRKNLKEIVPITDRDYFVRGSTALLDAIGETICHIESIYKYAREEDLPEKTLVVITTDGMENSSCRYSFDSIKQMVKRKQDEHGWEFIFLGANIDAVTLAGKMGFRKGNVADYTYDSEGVQCCYDSVSNAIVSMRINERRISIPDFLRPIRKDYEARSKGKREA